MLENNNVHSIFIGWHIWHISEDKASKHFKAKDGTIDDSYIIFEVINHYSLHLNSNNRCKDYKI